MSKSLVLDAELYGIIYTGLIVSDCDLNRKELRAIGRVLDLVESYGVKQDNGTYIVDITRFDKDENITIEIDNYDFDILNKVLSAVKWKPIASRRIIRLFDVLDSQMKDD